MNHRELSHCKIVDAGMKLFTDYSNVNKTTSQAQAQTSMVTYDLAHDTEYMFKLKIFEEYNVFCSILELPFVCVVM